MRKLYIFFLIIILFDFKISYSTVGVLPQFDISVRNIHSNPGPNLQDSLIDFDIYMIWTNSNVSDPFNYAAGQTTLFWNSGIVDGPVINNVTTFLTKTGSDLPPGNQSITFTTAPAGGIALLRASANVPVNNNFLISTTFPGTKIISLRLRTSAHTFRSFIINARFKVGSSPNTLYSYFDPDGTVESFTDTTLYTRSYPEYGGIHSPIPRFYADPVIIKAGKYVNFFSQSDFALAWNWSFPGGTPETSFFINPGGIVYNTPGSYSVTLQVSNYVGSQSLTKPNYITVIPPMKLNLTAFPEGLFDPVFTQLSRTDPVTVYIRNTKAPFGIMDSAISKIDSINFSGLFNFLNANAGNYYIVVKHFNSIETWSKDGGEILLDSGIVNNYDFSTSSSQAYGNNLQIVGSKYCMFSGDVNQDGHVTLSDLIEVYNNSQNYVEGNYLPTDLNGDLIVDLTDLAICYNNEKNFVGIIRP